MDVVQGEAFAVIEADTDVPLFPHDEIPLRGERGAFWLRDVVWFCGCAIFVDKVRVVFDLRAEDLARIIGLGCCAYIVVRAVGQIVDVE